MSKHPKEARRLFVGAIVQIVVGDAGTERAAIVTRVHPEAAINVQALADYDLPPLWIANVQSEDAACEANKKGVGFPIRQFWRWPR